MKKVLPVVLVSILFLVLFTAQNSPAQKDPFEIGKEIAMKGKYSSPFWAWSAGNFGVTYDTELNTVAFLENPGSGNGTAVWWIKDLVSNKYLKFTYVVKNNEVQQKTTQDIPITKEKAEQEAWRILGHFGYSK